MPAVRSKNKSNVKNIRAARLDTMKFTNVSRNTKSEKEATKEPVLVVQEDVGNVGLRVDLAELGKRDMNYPVGTARLAYKAADGKRVTPHQWAVYDLVRTIPCGKVTTYKYICDKLGSGSPRSVGSALRNNPFAPVIPCHRVIASDLKLGGFMGEWGTESETGSRCARKREMLRQEGVRFTNGGRLERKEDLWRWTRSAM